MKSSFTDTIQRTLYEAVPKATPAGEVAAPRPTAALTRRERRVKDILLKELSKMSNSTTLGGLSYAEKQYLEKRLDVKFIDRELARMRRDLRYMPIYFGVMGVLFAGLFGFMIWREIQTGTLAWTDWALLLPVVSGIVSPYLALRAVRRRIFIYEALRELSDADEIDVTLSRAVEQADALIREIVDREVAFGRPAS